MAVFLSPVGGAGAQFFDNNGNPLTGGKLYTYAAGTTTPQATYTSSAGSTFHTNPIVLDAAGRVPGSSEIWLTDSAIYKFVLKTSDDVLLATWDQITGVNSNFVNYTTETEVQTATAGQTVFTLTTMSYQPATGSLTVYVDGVNQYEGTSYLETDSTTVTFLAGLHVGALVKFTTAVQTTGNATDASVVTYDPPFTGSVATNVQDKLAQTVSVKDFGAVGDGVTDDTAAIAAALTYAGTIKCGVYVPGTSASYKVTNEFTVPDGVTVYGDGWGSFIQQTTLNKDVFIAGNSNTFHSLRLKIADGDGSDFVNCIYASGVNNLTVENCFLESADLGGCGIHIRGVQNSQIRGNRIYGGKWPGGGPGASAADILLYSSGTSERHIIEGNHCLSNNSQGIFADALGYDGDILIANNICVTLDPATCTLTGTWAVAASGGVRRHGIVVGYNSSSVGGPRCVVNANICRNTRWTGIYKQGVSSGPVIISNNLCDGNGYEIGNSLSGGIYLNQSGQEVITGNAIIDFQNNVAGSVGGITVTSSFTVTVPSLIQGNKIIDSSSNGITLTTNSAFVDVVDNEIHGSYYADIEWNPNAGSATVGGHNISNNNIVRTSSNLAPGIKLSIQSSTLYTTVKNNVIVGTDSTTSDVQNTGIYRTGADGYIRIVDNSINKFYHGVYGSNYWSGGRMAEVQLARNMITNCTNGFSLGATTGAQTVPLVGNQFVNVTTASAAALGGAAAGRIVQQLGDNFIWQTTSSPTAGTWAVGDRSQNSAPAVGQPKAWTCTAAGAPGTWVSEGNL